MVKRGFSQGGKNHQVVNTVQPCRKYALTKNPVNTVKFYFNFVKDKFPNLANLSFVLTVIIPLSSSERGFSFSTMNATKKSSAQT